MSKSIKNCLAVTLNVYFQPPPFTRAKQIFDEMIDISQESKVDVHIRVLLINFPTTISGANDASFTTADGYLSSQLLIERLEYSKNPSMSGTTLTKECDSTSSDFSMNGL
ncbi:hypothetical protein L484_027026 [Morus notabilis]|uniref:Uncharacterized protein n=1 Tax=Morus notabilis TaxID=981085 RepID=W9R9G7_9ROSA|nr:hypothetical protein L484_027026 [Morus notabilis]